MPDTKLRPEHVYLVPRGTGGQFAAMDVAQADFIRNHEHSNVYDRRVMELPADEQAALGLAGRYWKVTIVEEAAGCSTCGGSGYVYPHPNALVAMVCPTCKGVS